MRIFSVKCLSHYVHSLSIVSKEAFNLSAVTVAFELKHPIESRSFNYTVTSLRYSLKYVFQMSILLAAICCMEYFEA